MLKLRRASGMPFAKTSVSEAFSRLGVVNIPSVALDEDLDAERLRDLNTTGALPRLGDRLPDPVELVRLADLDALCFEPRDCGA